MIRTVGVALITLAGCQCSPSVTTVSESTPVSKAVAPAETPPMPVFDPSRSTSIGSPNDGSLEGGFPIPVSSPGLRFNDKRDTDARYATAEVAQALVDAARHVHEALGGRPLVFNDASLQQGGPIDHHDSHQSGRDVDLLFYLLNEDGNPAQPVGAFFDPEGVGVDFGDLADPSDDVVLRFDARRTWRLIEALLRDERAVVQRIFVAEHLRVILVEHAKSVDVSPALLQRFNDVACQPSVPHDDHLHVRFFCSVQDIQAGCLDTRPLYPWRRATLAEQGVRAKLAGPRRPQSRSNTVSIAEARKKAGPMHADVVRWLDRRERWLKPRIGRRYCRGAR